MVSLNVKMYVDQENLHFLSSLDSMLEHLMINFQAITKKLRKNFFFCFIVFTRKTL